MYLIWSQKHNQWWGADRCGYTPNASLAGKYDEKGAAHVVLGSFPPGSNIAVSESSEAMFLKMREENGGKVVTRL